VESHCKPDAPGCLVLGWHPLWALQCGCCGVGGGPHNGHMTRFGIDALTAIRIVRETVVVAPEHRLVAPKLLSSQTLSLLYRDVREGTLDKDEARTILDGITTMKIRLLGDRVSRGSAWKLADRLGWDDTTNAEYVAVALLQADAFITLDPALASEVRGIVTLAPFDALLA
jgi:predicted nucleic acid-binding protein